MTTEKVRIVNTAGGGHGALSEAYAIVVARRAHQPVDGLPVLTAS